MVRFSSEHADGDGSVNDLAHNGGVFAPDLSSGRGPADVTVTVNGVYATASTGEVFSLSFECMTLERGGASGKMIFCRVPDQPEVCVYTEAPGFVEALGLHGGAQLTGQIAAIAARSRRGRRHIAALWLGFVALCVGAWFGFSALVGGAMGLIPFAVDEAIGEMASEHMTSQLGGPVVDVPEVTEALEKIVARLAPEASREGVEFSLRVVRSDAVNAFALPGGQMAVFTGLIDASDSYEEVAAVMGHEMAHVTQRHGVRRIVQSLGIVAVAQLVFGDVGGAVGAIEELFTLAAINGYSRDQESEADAEGVRMMHAAGLDPTAAARFFQILKDEHAGIDTGGLLSWMSTHPEHEERIDAVHALAKHLGPAEERPLDIDWAAVKASLSLNADTPGADEDRSSPEGVQEEQASLRDPVKEEAQ